MGNRLSSQNFSLSEHVLHLVTDAAAYKRRLKPNAVPAILSNNDSESSRIVSENCFE